MVPVREKSPPNDVPPPLSMVLFVISKSPPEDWASAIAVIRTDRMDKPVVCILFKTSSSSERKSILRTMDNHKGLEG